MRIVAGFVLWEHAGDWRRRIPLRSEHVQDTVYWSLDAVVLVDDARLASSTTAPDCKSHVLLSCRGGPHVSAGLLECRVAKARQGHPRKRDINCGFRKLDGAFRAVSGTC
ncbi:hypothetical protein BS78_02G287200 [Paspalum vaginatum]|nr:hypothetical protein BS78_02G287200 [Paspalum vaginatum]